MIFLGCDAGSTKTEFLLVSSRRGLLARRIFPACNYLEAGHEAFSAAMRRWIAQILDEGGTSSEQISFSVFGLPTLGEVEGLEHKARHALGAFAPRDRSLLVNDAVLGWAGSLAGRPGINVVSGTGSITYGQDDAGNAKRVGGWSLLFDDPGSSTWVARQTLSLFFRQADGRAPRGPLYSVLCNHWALGNHPSYFGGKLLPILNTNRSELAKVQLLSRQALDAGDASVARIYEQAVELLAQSAEVVRNALRFSSHERVKVSYSGGFFKNGEIVIRPFQRLIKQMNMDAVEPLYCPAVGAVALGAKPYLAPDALNEFLQNIQEVINTHHTAP